MSRAVEAVKMGEKVTVAARRFLVPRITLLNKVTGKYPINCSMGPSTILSKTEEDILVKWLLSMAERYFPVSKGSLKDSVQKIGCGSKETESVQR